MPDRKKPKQRVADSLQMELDFLTTSEAIVKIEETVQEHNYPSDGIMFADQGSNQANEHDVYIHQTINTEKSKKKLEKNIAKKGGDANWIGAHS